ncbi:CIP2A protein [Phytophthora cinnamomi]|uniref:CIP2A protein n=1 Tax=Phytophthora cinnamomi TaxID=4785 RepID=UPI00355A837F|nr:CIP2A protein [Phytophthora cinnamomi]
MEDSDADATFTSFASSISGAYNRRATVEKRSKKPGRSALVVAVDSYLASPGAATASDLYKSARKLSAHNEFFSANHTTLCLQLLDTLAEHLLAVVAPTKPQEAREEEDDADEVQATQYSQPTQTQQTPEDSLQLLELCYLFARKTAIGYPSHALCKLLQWLVESVSVAALRNGCENDTGLKLQLLVLAELIKISAGVRIYAKEMKKIKDFYRSLTILLNSTEDAELLVFSMAVLARLVLSESVGSKLFSEKNVDQAFALVFSVLDGSWHDSAGESMSDATTILDRRSLLQLGAEDNETLSNSDEYLHSVEVCHLLAKLSELTATRVQL